MTEFVISLIAAGGYWGIAFLMCLENVVPPVPSELIMGLGGIAAAHGQMAMIPLIAAGTAGTVLGNYFWYYLGRRLGKKRLKAFVDRHGRWLTLDWAEVERLQRFFDRYGGGVVFVFRFLPAFRTIISLPAGMMHMPHWRFVIWTTGGSLIWNSFLAGAGYFLGRRFTAVEEWIGPATIVTVVLFVIWYLWRVLTWRPAAAAE